MPDSLQTARLLSGLTVDELTDDDLTGLLDLNADTARLAAADGLEIVASRLTYVSSDDVTVDGTKRAAALLKRAEQLRAQHAATDPDTGDSFFFDTVFDSGYRPELTEPEAG